MPRQRHRTYDKRDNSGRCFEHSMQLVEPGPFGINGFYRNEASAIASAPYIARRQYFAPMRVRDPPITSTDIN